MKKILSVFAILFLSCKVWAYSFSAVSPNGQTLYYWILSDSTVSVTFPGNNTVTSTPWGGYTKPVGFLVIPNNVTYEGNIYSVKRITYNAFDGCDSITSVSIPTTVDFIGSYAFRNCTRLDSIIIPNSIVSIGIQAFNGCEDLSYVNLTGTIVDWCKIHFAGNTSNPLYYANHLYINNSEVTLLNIPDVVDTIHDYAFYKCQGITTAIIGKSVVSIGEDAFWNCSGLTTVYFNADSCSALPHTYHNPFSACFSLTSLTIGDNVKKVPDYMMRGINSLTNVTIGRAVKYIGENAFLDCSSLTRVNYTGTIANWCGIQFQSYGNPILIAHNLYINDFEVTTLEIPDTVQSISSSAFNHCYSLTSVVLPESITSIGVAAFYQCNNITDIYSKRQTAPTIGNNSIPTTALIHIPCESSLSYQARWGYGYIYDEELLYDLTVKVDDNTHGSITILQQPSCDNNAIIQATASANYVFSRWSNGVTSNPYSLVVNSDTTITAIFEPINGIDDKDDINTKVYSNNGQIVVEGANGNTVTLYDLSGRNLATKHDYGTAICFDVPITGAYMIKIGNHAARKVVVMQ